MCLKINDRIKKKIKLYQYSFIKKNMNVMFSKYGVEKYDAFDDVGGKLSFALALLDQDNSGVILNAVHSRDNCFLWTLQADILSG